MDTLPTIIQGGMGAGVSDWRLARAVSACGQLGVVSGTALDVIVARRLQAGDQGTEGGGGLRAAAGGALREALALAGIEVESGDGKAVSFQVQGQVLAHDTQADDADVCLQKVHVRSVAPTPVGASAQ